MYHVWCTTRAPDDDDDDDTHPLFFPAQIPHILPHTPPVNVARSHMVVCILLFPAHIQLAFTARVITFKTTFVIIGPLKKHTFPAHVFNSNITLISCSSHGIIYSVCYDVCSSYSVVWKSTHSAHIFPHIFSSWFNSCYCSHSSRALFLLFYHSRSLLGFTLVVWKN